MFQASDWQGESEALCDNSDTTRIIEAKTEQPST